jgi:alpha-beta hydrolase superfamily lysophospholipase
LRLDARSGFDFIRTAAPASRIAVFAESPGTGIAVEPACDRPVAGLVLHSPYVSVRRFYELHGPPLLPYRLLVQDPIDAEAIVARVSAPILILQGTADTLVPIAESRRLFAAALEPKTMIEIEGAGHLQAWAGDARTRGLDLPAAWTR